jgi:O-antigen/teichoic acid export membrane protein
MSPHRHAPGSLAGVAMLNAVAGLAARLATLVIAIALTPFVLGRLGPALYGISAATGSMVEYLLLLRGGLGMALRRYVTVTFHGGDEALAGRYYAVGFWWMAVLRLVVVAAGVALSRWLCVFMKIPPNLLTDATGGVVLIVVAAGFSDTGLVFEVPTYATGHTARLSLVKAAGAVLKAALVVPAFLLFVPSLTLYAGTVCVVELLIALGIAAVGARTRVVPRIAPAPDFGSPEVRGTLFRFGGLGLVSQVAGILYLATDNLLIGGIYGSEYVTSYSLGTRWAPMITILLSTGISALTPLLTQLEARGEEHRSRDMVLRAASVNSALGVPLCLVPCIVGDIFLTQWVGPQYRESARYMVAMLLPTAVVVTMEPVWVAMVARGRIGGIAVGDISVAVANPVLSLILALPLGLGLMGFALGNAVAMLIKNLLLRPLLGRGEEGIPSLWATFRTLPAALLGGAPALVLLWLARPLYAGSLQAVLLAGFLGGLLCLAGSLLTAVGWKDTRRLAQALVRRLRGEGAVTQ